MTYNENDPKAVELLTLVESELRRSGGRHLLTREEYLQIVNMCFQQVYGYQPDVKGTQEFASIGA